MKPSLTVVSAGGALPFYSASQLKEQLGSSPRGPAGGGGAKLRSCFCSARDSLRAFSAAGREGGEWTVDESQFDNAVAEVRGVRGRYVLTFYHVSDKSSLLSLQTSRKRNKNRGMCFISKI